MGEHPDHCERLGHILIQLLSLRAGVLAEAEQRGRELDSARRVVCVPRSDRR